MIGIPYQGSKRKLAKPIIDYITTHNPNAKYIYDLFGGGGSISFEALKRNQFKGVFYNEFNTGVVELLKYIRTHGVTPEFYNWIDRETFEKHKNDNDWFGGLLKTCWSFGNNQRCYLFGKDIEEPKRRMHEIVVNCCSESLNWFNETYCTEISELLFNMQSINERRLRFQRELSKVYDMLLELRHLENVNKLKEIGVAKQLEQLQRMQQLEQLERLEISNLSYELVNINTPIDETIIYCDPPYKGTVKYQKDIDHDLFLDWVKNSKYKIYVSSYDFDLPIVKEFVHRSTLSATANNKVTERLFCNQLEAIKTELF